MTNTKGRADQVEVMRADRDAAAEYMALIIPSMPRLADVVRENQTALSRAFARHRIASRQPDPLLEQMAAVLNELFTYHVDPCQVPDGMLRRVEVVLADYREREAGDDN